MNKPEFLKSQVSSVFKARYGNFIGGQWVEPLGGRYFDDTTPVTGAKLTEIKK